MQRLTCEGRPHAGIIGSDDVGHLPVDARRDGNEFLEVLRGDCVLHDSQVLLLERDHVQGLHLDPAVFVIHPLEAPRYGSFTETQRPAIIADLPCPHPHCGGVAPLANLGPNFPCRRHVEHRLVLFGVAVRHFSVLDRRGLIEAVHVSAWDAAPQSSMVPLFKVAPDGQEAIGKAEDGLIELVLLLDVLCLHNGPVGSARIRRCREVLQMLQRQLLPGSGLQGRYVFALQPLLQNFCSSVPLEVGDADVGLRRLLHSPRIDGPCKPHHQSKIPFTSCSTTNQRFINDDSLLRGYSQLGSGRVPGIWCWKSLQSFSIEHPLVYKDVEQTKHACLLESLL
mmetsp:Transcript_144858/g.252611  ORF Transcript_144858/g.252611 Transcript_144858/m.252611 type:complete len:338 (+) Transcript_144858:3106-4119(+)